MAAFNQVNTVMMIIQQISYLMLFVFKFSDSLPYVMTGFQIGTVLIAQPHIARLLVTLHTGPPSEKTWLCPCLQLNVERYRTLSFVHLQCTITYACLEIKNVRKY